ncbi:hypothetical protein ABC382_00895 [Lysinibacillus sp. 1P01SD]|uniref:hypothetical protein n=1 Tax=Lysinibacillus sp. 1P01SD TaxID=3132285 RepID=UPI00399FB863
MKEVKMTVLEDYSKLGRIVYYNSHNKEVVGSPISAEHFDGFRKYLNEIGDFFANNENAVDLFKNHNLGYAGEMLERFEEREYFNNPHAVEALAVMASLMFVENYAQRKMVHYEGQIEGFGLKLRTNTHTKENAFVNVLSYLWELNHLEENTYEERAKSVLESLESGNYVDSLTAFQRTFCRGLMTTFSGEYSQKLHSLLIDSDIFADTFNSCGFQEKIFIITQLASDYEGQKWKKGYWSNDSMYHFVMSAWRLAKKYNLNRSDFDSIAEKLGLGKFNHGTLISLYLYLVDINLLNAFSYNKQNSIFVDMIFSLDFFTKDNYIPTMYEHYLMKKWNPRENAVLDGLAVLAKSYKSKGVNFDNTLIYRVKMLLVRAYKFDHHNHGLKKWVNVPFEFVAYVMGELRNELPYFEYNTSLVLEKNGIIIPFIADVDSNEKRCIEHYIGRNTFDYELAIGDILSFMDFLLDAYSTSLLPSENDENKSYNTCELPNLLRAIESVRLWFNEPLKTSYSNYYNLLISYNIHEINVRTAEGIVEAFNLNMQNCIISDFTNSLDDVEVLKAMKSLGEKVYDFIASLKVSSFDNIKDTAILEEWIALYLETHFEINPFKFPNAMTEMYIHCRKQGIEVDFGVDTEIFFQKALEMEKYNIIQINQVKHIGEYFKTEAQKLDDKMSELELKINENHGNKTEHAYTFRDTFKKIIEVINFVQSLNNLHEPLKKKNLKILNTHFDALFREALERKDVHRMYMYDMYVALDNITNIEGEEEIASEWWSLYALKTAEIRSDNSDLSNRKIAYYDFIKTTVLPLEAQIKSC